MLCRLSCDFFCVLKQNIVFNIVFLQLRKTQTVILYNELVKRFITYVIIFAVVLCKSVWNFLFYTDLLYISTFPFLSSGNYKARNKGIFRRREPPSNRGLKGIYPSQARSERIWRSLWGACRFDGTIYTFKKAVALVLLMVMWIVTAKREMGG